MVLCSRAQEHKTGAPLCPSSRRVEEGQPAAGEPRPANLGFDLAGFIPRLREGVTEGKVLPDEVTGRGVKG